MKHHASAARSTHPVARRPAVMARRPSPRAARLLAPLLLGSLLAAVSAAAQTPGGHIDSMITSDSKETMVERTVFPPTQPKVYVFYMMIDAAKGQTVRALWIAEKVEGMPASNRFSEVTTSSAGGTYWGCFSYPKPKDGPWPTGTYRVEILIDGKLAASAKFRIQG